MKRILLAACLAACFVTPARAGGGLPPSVESCDTLTESMASATKMAAEHHATVTFLDGTAAHRFLAAVIPAGSKLIVDGDHVAVFEDPLFNSVFVNVADGICGGYGTMFGLDAPAALAALAASVH